VSSCFMTRSGRWTLHLAQNRSHVRGIVVDSRIGWTGGFGIDDKWFGDGRSNGSWRETNVRFEGPAVRQLQAVFAAAWVEATGVLYTGRAMLLTQENGVTAAGLLYATPTVGSTAAGRFFALSIAGARRTLYITNAYLAPNRSFIEQLAAAARRGVDVRILTAGPRTDVNIVRLAGRASYDTLLDAGVRLYEWPAYQPCREDGDSERRQDEKRDHRSMLLRATLRGDYVALHAQCSG
jgi:cardiolipin synthase A/B